MRWAWKLLALVAAGALGTNALDATIFTFPHLKEESHNRPYQAQTISEDFARLILELRTKSSLGSVLGRTETKNVDWLNQFADTEFTLFGGSDGHAAPARSLLLVEGVDGDAGSAIQNIQPNYIVIPHISSTLVDGDALESFVEGVGEENHCTHNSNADVVGSSSSQTAKECLSKDPVLSHGRDLFANDFVDLINFVQTWASSGSRTTVSRLSIKPPKSPKDAIFVTRTLESFFRGLAHESFSDKREITVLVLPSSIDLPISEHNLSRRGVAGTPSLLSKAISSKQDTLKRYGQGTSVPSTLLPVCHSTNSSCVEATNNCSGHGHCYLKYGSSNEDSTGNCYACQCQQTVVKRSDGSTETVQWGGSACQKRDISSPFFLIAGISVVAVVVISGAIGMLFSMGQEELPSVIGAGVGGSKAQM